MNENEQRRNVAQLASYGYTHPGITKGSGFYGLLTVLLMSRAASGSWLDTTGMTARPGRTLLWFLLGASIHRFYTFLSFANSHG